MPQWAPAAQQLPVNDCSGSRRSRPGWHSHPPALGPSDTTSWHTTPADVAEQPGTRPEVGRHLRCSNNIPRYTYTKHIYIYTYIIYITCNVCVCMYVCIYICNYIYMIIYDIYIHKYIYITHKPDNLVIHRTCWLIVGYVMLPFFIFLHNNKTKLRSFAWLWIFSAICSILACSPASAAWRRTNVKGDWWSKKRSMPCGNKRLYIVI